MVRQPIELFPAVSTSRLSISRAVVQVRGAGGHEVAAVSTEGARVSTVAVGKRSPVTVPLEVAPNVRGAHYARAVVTIELPRPIEFEVISVNQRTAAVAEILTRGSVQYEVRAENVRHQGIGTVNVQKGAAMLPGMVMSLRLVSVGRTTITLAWARPDLGTGQLLHYEYEVGTGIWVTTQSTAETVTIMGLTPDTPYALRVRARTTVGRGPSSQTLRVRTVAISTPGTTRGERAEPTGETSLDIIWEAAVESGGSGITHYQVCVIDEDGRTLPFENTATAATFWRVRGLAIGHRYGFRLRAVNAAGPGTAKRRVLRYPRALPRAGNTSRATGAAAGRGQAEHDPSAGR